MRGCLWFGDAKGLPVLASQFRVNLIKLSVISLAYKVIEPMKILNFSCWHYKLSLYRHARKSFKYGEAEALAEVKRWMEHLA
jgi:hypothetical protein